MRLNNFVFVQVIMIIKAKHVISNMKQQHIQFKIKRTTKSLGVEFPTKRIFICHFYMCNTAISVTLRMRGYVLYH